MDKLGERVRKFREHPSRNWNTARLAREVGTTRQSVENLEAGAVGMPKYLAKLAQVMGTTVDDLLSARQGATPLAAREVSPAYRPDIGQMGVEDALVVIGRALAAASMERRPAIGTNLRQWALDGGPEHYVPVLLTLLAQPTAKLLATG